MPGDLGHRWPLSSDSSAEERGSCRWTGVGGLTGRSVRPLSGVRASSGLKHVLSHRRRSYRVPSRTSGSRPAAPPPQVLSLLSPRSPGPEGAGGPKPRAQPERHRSGSRSSSGLGRERLGHVSGSPGLSVVTPSFLARECLLYTRPKERRSQFGVILPQDDIGQYTGTFLVVTTGEAVLLARGG